MSAYQSKRAARSQLPPNVAPGDKLRLVPNVTNGSEDAHPLPCVVESIPHHRRFAVIRFEVSRHNIFDTNSPYTFRECWPISPPAKDIASKPEPHRKRSANTH